MKVKKRTIISSLPVSNSDDGNMALTLSPSTTGRPLIAIRPVTHCAICFVCAYFISTWPLCEITKYARLLSCVAVTSERKNQRPPLREARINDLNSNTKAGLSNLANGMLEHWWEPYVENASRAYSEWPIDLAGDHQKIEDEQSKFSWCRPPADINTTDNGSGTSETNSTFNISSMINGLIYIKSHKASSSTCSGVARSIAHKVGRRMFGKYNVTDSSSNQTIEEDIPCIHHAYHFAGDKNRHANRNATHSLLWTFVRHPAARDLSHVYYFDVSNKGMEPTDDSVVRRLQKLRSIQTRYLAPHVGRFDASWPGYDPQERPNEFVSLLRQEIFDNYEFIGITERMEESLAAMTLLWHLPASDVIVLSAKRSRTYDSEVRRGRCNIVHRAQRTPTVREYLDTSHAVNNLDFFLYRTAVRSLDKTIDAIGRDRVAERANEIRTLQDVATRHCLLEAVFPCSENGEVQVKEAKKSCYAADTGCGHACVDRVLEQYRLGLLDG